VNGSVIVDGRAIADRRDASFCRRPTGSNRVPTVSRLVPSGFSLVLVFNIGVFVCIRCDNVFRLSPLGQEIYQQ